MLSIGSNVNKLQTFGVKKAQNKPKSSSQIQNANPNVSRQGGPQVNYSPVNTLEVMAMSNLINNNKMTPDLRESAMASMSARIDKSLGKESSKMGNISSEINQTRQDLDAIKSLLGTNDGSISDAETRIYQLIADSLQSKLSAFEQLLEIAKDNMNQLSTLANFGVNQVIGESDKSNSIMEMLSRSNSEYSSDASSKLLQEASTSPDATNKIGGLIKKGKIDLKKTATQASQEDPEKTAVGLDNVYRNTALSKEDKLTVTSVLTKIAMDNPLNGAGKASANALENIFKKDSGTVARNAATGLRFAAIAGNEHATEGLINVATSKAVDKSKSALAIEELTKVAKSGGNQSTRATGVLNKMAQSPNFSGKLKETLVDSLSQIAYNGGENGKQSLETLGSIAGNNNDPASKNAFDSILKMNSNHIFSNTEVVKNISNIAQSKRTDTKMQRQATETLGQAMVAGSAGAAQHAEDGIVKVASDPQNKSADVARQQLQRFGLFNLTKSNQQVMKVQAKQEDKKHEGKFSKAKDEKVSNPFFTPDLMMKMQVSF